MWYAQLRNVPSTSPISSRFFNGGTIDHRAEAWSKSTHAAGLYY